MQCYLCQNENADHETSKCPNILCKKCGERGHAKLNCKMVAGKSEMTAISVSQKRSLDSESKSDIASKKLKSSPETKASSETKFQFEDSKLFPIPMAILETTNHNEDNDHHSTKTGSDQATKIKSELSSIKSELEEFDRTFLKLPLPVLPNMSIKEERELSDSEMTDNKHNVISSRSESLKLELPLPVKTLKSGLSSSLHQYQATSRNKEILDKMDPKSQEVSKNLVKFSGKKSVKREKSVETGSSTNDPAPDRRVIQQVHTCSKFLDEICKSCFQFQVTGKSDPVHTNRLKTGKVFPLYLHLEVSSNAESLLSRERATFKIFQSQSHPNFEVLPGESKWEDRTIKVSFRTKSTPRRDLNLDPIVYNDLAKLVVCQLPRHLDELFKEVPEDVIFAMNRDENSILRPGCTRNGLVRLRHNSRYCHGDTVQVRAANPDCLKIANSDDVKLFFNGRSAKLMAHVVLENVGTSGFKLYNNKVIGLLDPPPNDIFN